MTLSESRLRVGLSLSTPPLLLALALAVWTGGVSGWVAGGLVLVSPISGWFVLFDFATSIILDTDGIIRRFIARNHVIEWAAIDRIMRRPRHGLVLVTGDGEHHSSSTASSTTPNSTRSSPGSGLRESKSRVDPALDTHCTDLGIIRMWWIVLTPNC